MLNWSSMDCPFLIAPSVFSNDYLNNGYDFRLSKMLSNQHIEPVNVHEYLKGDWI